MKSYNRNQNILSKIVFPLKPDNCCVNESIKMVGNTHDMTCIISSISTILINHFDSRGQLTQMGERPHSNPAFQGWLSLKAKLYRQIDGTSFALVAIKCTNLTSLEYSFARYKCLQDQPRHILDKKYSGFYTCLDWAKGTSSLKKFTLLI